MRTCALKVGPKVGMLLAVAMLGASACSSREDRSGKLLMMAAQEAANIPGRLDRFSRQLNIADTQLATNRTADADRTLLLAQETLVSSGKAEFDDFHRIAAWTSISQLARRAKDQTLAAKAADNAQAALNDVQPVVDRPQYVDSLATELDALRGHAAAAELLNTGAAWAAEIKDTPLRRYALFTFANHLVQMDAFENAKAALEHEPDPAWRTDTLLSMANQSNGGGATYASNTAEASTPLTPPASVVGGGGGGRGGFSGGAAQAGSSPSVGGFNKDVRFENVFRQSH